MELNVYAQRWGHSDRYNVNRTSIGWEISINTIVGECDKEGKPNLFDILKQNYVSYPADLGIYMELLWDLAEQEQLPEDKIQKHLNAFGEWITATEKSKPNLSHMTF